MTRDESGGTSTPHTGGVASGDLAIARQFVNTLAERCDPALFTVTLFGSRARGDAADESDLDLFVALACDDPGNRIKKTVRRIAADLTLEHGILVSVRVADRTFLERHRGYGLLEAVEREGIRV